ncbi:MAG: hypothetical protein J5793_05070 [Clostridia bacterium]|nr:hypothetical protein [Clostridia bacterium]
MNENAGKNNNVFKKTASVLLIAALFAVLCFAVPVFAWLYGDRDAATVAVIDNPAAIYIDAANREDIRYMNMSGINVEDESGVTYKDFVFCVSGNDVDAYKLQLAYTTNNQFEYELYHARLASGSVPNDAFTAVLYTTHPDGTEQNYYVDSSDSTPIAGVFRNKKTVGGEDLAYDWTDTGNTAYHDLTYEISDSPGDYRNVNKYAEPIYWQTSSTMIPSSAVGTFYDYYIIRVIWSSGVSNTKETDMIYITARNISAD